MNLNSTYPRELKPVEAELLLKMIRKGGGQANQFLPQLKGIMVSSGCKCGCASFSLQISADIPSVSSCDGKIISDQVGRTAKGELVGAILWQEQGRLSELEVYSVDGQTVENTCGLPLPDSLVPADSILHNE
jgi:hypothetical protein